MQKSVVYIFTKLGKMFLSSGSARADLDLKLSD